MRKFDYLQREGQLQKVSLAGANSYTIFEMSSIAGIKFAKKIWGPLQQQRTGMPAYHSLLYQLCKWCIAKQFPYEAALWLQIPWGRPVSFNEGTKYLRFCIVCHLCSLAVVSSLPTAHAGDNNTWHLMKRKPQHHSAGWQTTSLSMARSLSSWQCQVGMHMLVFVDDPAQHTNSCNGFNYWIDYISHWSPRSGLDLTLLSQFNAQVAAVCPL